MDGCRVPLVGRHRRPGRRTVSLYWCHWCAAGFVLVGEGDAARDVARFTVDAKTATVAVTGVAHHEDVDAAVLALGADLVAKLG
jgi:hypothetical protein